MSITRVHIETQKPYDVLVGPGALNELSSGTAVLSDETVSGLHAHRLAKLANAPLLGVPVGESSKTFAQLETVLGFMVDAGLDRSSTLVALGGGVVGDLGGLAASLYMRGISLIQAPTTLLAQCDSAIGGKTAVNLAGGKNLAGTFHQPTLVVSDTETLSTLPASELRSGLGEVVKTGLVGDDELLGLVEREPKRILACDADLLGEIVTRCSRVKGSVVAADEREGDERRKLNLGHTFGHTIERVAGYGVIPHGEAVATGLVLAAEAAQRSGLLKDEALPERLTRILQALGLPPSLDALRERYARPLAASELIEGMRHDKKGSAGAPEFVLPESTGSLRCGVPLEPALLEDLLR